MDKELRYINGSQRWARNSEKKIGDNFIGAKTGMAPMIWAASGSLKVYIENSSQMQEYTLNGTDFSFGMSNSHRFKSTHRK